MLEPLEVSDRSDPFDLTEMEALLEPDADIPPLSDTALLADDSDVHMQSLLDRPLDATTGPSAPSAPSASGGAFGGARPGTKAPHKAPTFVTTKRKANSPVKPKAKKTSLADQIFGRPGHIPGLLNPPSLRQLRSNTAVQDIPLPKVPLERKQYTRTKRDE